MAFKHNLRAHLGEMLRGAFGFRMARRLVALGPLLAVLAAAPPAIAAKARPAALPDTVIARLPHRDLTVEGLRATWARLDPRYRPAGEGRARNRPFLEQLIEKEAMARTALAEPFTMTERESAQFLAYRKQMERQELYRILIADSARVTAADRESALVRMTAMPDGSPTPPQAIEAAARPLAERRRVDELEKLVKDIISPVWDDSVAAFLARGYAALDPRRPDLERPFSATLPGRVPALTAADSTRVLATSGVGPLSIAEFAGRFLMLNPFEAPLPTSADAVKARGEQFLGQVWFDAEVARRDVVRRPAVVAALAERRESVALDHWYARHVRAAIDTSETALRAHYAADPSPYGVPAHSLVSQLVVPAQATADSIVRVLAAGAPWESLCTRFATAPYERESCGRTIAINDTGADSVLVARLAPLARGEAFARAESPDGAWRVIRLVDRVAARIRPFEEARSFVVRDLAGREAESILTGQMAALVKAMPVRINERALAELDLEP